MRPKAREMTQHGGPSGWLEESEPAGGDLCCNGRSMPPSLTDRTVCSGHEQLSCELLANPAAVANVLVQNVHKKPSRKEGMGQNPSLSVHLPKRISVIKRQLLTLKILMFDSL